MDIGGFAVPRTTLKKAAEMGLLDIVSETVKIISEVVTAGF